MGTQQEPESFEGGWQKEGRINQQGIETSIIYLPSEVDGDKYPHITICRDSNGNLVKDPQTRFPKNHVSDSKNGPRYGGREIREIVDRYKDPNNQVQVAKDPRTEIENPSYWLQEEDGDYAEVSEVEGESLADALRSQEEDGDYAEVSEVEGESLADALRSQEEDGDYAEVSEVEGESLAIESSQSNESNALDSESQNSEPSGISENGSTVSEASGYESGSSNSGNEGGSSNGGNEGSGRG
jgi:hypothetical protein